MEENKEYLTKQILTYIGNKRKLLPYIDTEVKNIKKELGQEKIVTADLFSGSGIVARLLKQHSSYMAVNDLEYYSYIINACYLTNKHKTLGSFEEKDYNYYLQKILKEVEENPIEGIITSEYCPKNDNNIQPNERCFYTRKNGIFIDSVRYYIDKLIPYDIIYFWLLGRLLVEASIHTNTSGVFKGFYKDKNTGIGKFGGSGQNALDRICGAFNMNMPVLSNFYVPCTVYQEDANISAKYIINCDVAYLDPPYNQHPYGSNYFMLNLIAKNKIDAPTSWVSGIPNNWNRSNYNKKDKALSSLEEIIDTLDTKYFIISYNNEGFISLEEMENMLQKYGELETKTIEYNTFRGSRNLRNRSLKTNEYLFTLKKGKLQWLMQ